MAKKPSPIDAESARISDDARRAVNWTRWGPYLAERQWATVREDYSTSGDAWAYFPFEHAHVRAYRWGDDGLLGPPPRPTRWRSPPNWRTPSAFGAVLLWPISPTHGGSRASAAPRRRCLSRRR